MTTEELANPVRLDKWLWAARFYKTRQLAIDAINAGHIEINEERPKPSRNVKIMDRILIRKPPFEFHIIVAALSEKRGAASVAQQLYTETVTSKAQREMRATELKQFPVFLRGRPTKKDRRDIERHNERFMQQEEQD